MNSSELDNKIFGELGIIALESANELGIKVNSHIINRRMSNNENSKEKTIIPETYINEIDEIRFANGEGKAKLRNTVRGKDIYIIADIGNHFCTYNMFGKTVYKGPDEHFQDIKRTISAIGGKARRTTVIMPLLYASRQDRRRGRESLDAALALQELERMGIKDIITFDVHDSRVQNAVPLVSFENLYPTYGIVKMIVQQEEELRINKDSMIVISPDTGAMDRAIYYSSILKIDIGLFYKRRDHTKLVQGRNPIIKHEYMGSSVEGKDVLIVDDMIASGESVLDIAFELKKRNANNIFIAATFGLFTEGLGKFEKAYEDGIVTRVYTTNLTSSSERLKIAPWYRNVDMSEYLAEIIDNLNHDKSIAPLLDSTYGIKKLMKIHDLDN